MMTEPCDKVFLWFDWNFLFVESLALAKSRIARFVFSIFRGLLVVNLKSVLPFFVHNKKSSKKVSIIITGHETYWISETVFRGPFLEIRGNFKRPIIQVP